MELECKISKRIYRESQLLVELRSSVAETCDYLLRTAGLRRSDELQSAMGKFHGRQIDLLARLLSNSNDPD